MHAQTFAHDGQTLTAQGEIVGGEPGTAVFTIGIDSSKDQVASLADEQLILFLTSPGGDPSLAVERIDLIAAALQSLRAKLLRRMALEAPDETVTVTGSIVTIKGGQ